MDFLTDINPPSLALQATSLLLALYVLTQLLKPLATISSRGNQNYSPVGGTIFHQFMNIHRLLDYHTDLSRRHKTFRMVNPLWDSVFTVDPTNVEYILRTNFANYGKGEFFYSVTKDLFGDGIFAVDGEKWRLQRKIASYEFSGRILRNYSSVVFRENAAKLAEIVSKSSSSNKMIDIQHLLMKTSLDSIFKVGFGTELNTLSGSSKEGMDFGKAFDDASSMVFRRFFDFFWKLKKFLNVELEANMKKNIKYIDAFVYKIIADKVEQQKAEQRDDLMMKEDILSRFLLERKKNPSSMSYKYLRDIILNFVIAGRDTTAGTLAWFFYMLCKHPDVQEKVAQEVKEATNTKGNITVVEFSKSLTDEALNNMQYLHAALSETLRLYPPVPMDVKECFSNDTLPDGFAVKKGDVVNYQPYSMGRMKFLWGEDAEDFRPGRWLNNDGKFQAESPFKFTAFQAGPRICLGKEFAYTQMKIVAATLVKFFEFKLWDEERLVNYRSMLTLQIDGGLHVSAIHR